MTASLFTLCPPVQSFAQTAQLPCLLGAHWLGFQERLFGLNAGLLESGQTSLTKETPLAAPLRWGAFLSREISGQLRTLERAWRHQHHYYGLFGGRLPPQTWSAKASAQGLLLDLPGFRVHDLSTAGPHQIENYTVVFAPRAGHHSNIAQRLALKFREYGLSRLALVEQKCADEIPVAVDGHRHYEDFEGQYRQYREILRFLKAASGHPSHLVAVCQPGPLLMATLILNPSLGKTFGSAGSPMHTRAQKGFLTDFARLMGESYVDWLVANSHRVAVDKESGHTRRVFDGRLHVLGFYALGFKQHLRNLNQLQRDIWTGKHDKAQRQIEFYRWYNYVHHFPAGFIRDTYRQIFVRNALVEGGLTLDGRAVRLQDYPAQVPIWALGGRRDDIAPPRQAVGHLDLLQQVPSPKRLSLTCDGGHMALFRSRKILAGEYGRIARFLLENSDTA